MRKTLQPPTIRQEVVQYRALRRTKILQNHVSSNPLPALPTSEEQKKKYNSLCTETQSRWASQLRLRLVFKWERSHLCVLLCTHADTHCQWKRFRFDKIMRLLLTSSSFPAPLDLLLHFLLNFTKRKISEDYVERSTRYSFTSYTHGTSKSSSLVAYLYVGAHVSSFLHPPSSPCKAMSVKDTSQRAALI